MTDKKQEDKMQALIRKVDAEYKANPIYSALTFELGIPFFMLMVLYVAFVFFIAENKNDLGVIFSVVISFFALIFSFSAFTDRARDRLHIERNYNLIRRNYDNKNKIEKFRVWTDLFFGKEVAQDALLKILIRIKNKNPHLLIEELYLKQPGLFTEKKLVESLIQG